MPCYERKEFFLGALESALNQTIKCKVIVIDNCSSHNYFEKVCKEKNVQYYRNETNIGMIANFAKGYELSETKYTMNLQDDDQLSPYYVEAFLYALKMYPDIDVFFTDFVILTTQGEKYHKHTLPFGYMKNGTKIIEYGIKYKLGFPYMASVINKTKAYRYADVKNCIGSYDWEWIYSVAHKLSFYGEKRKLYKYRVHNNQDTKVNMLIYRLSLPYVYDVILKGNVSDLKLKKKATRNAFWELVQLKSFARSKELKVLLSEKNKYNKYFKMKLRSSICLRAIFLMPQWFVHLIYKMFKKIGFSV